jgi:hypothetical protein
MPQSAEQPPASGLLASASECGLPESVVTGGVPISPHAARATKANGIVKLTQERIPSTRRKSFANRRARRNQTSVDRRLGQIVVPVGQLSMGRAVGRSMHTCWCSVQAAPTQRNVPHRDNAYVWTVLAHLRSWAGYTAESEQADLRSSGAGTSSSASSPALDEDRFGVDLQVRVGENPAAVRNAELTPVERARSEAAQAWANQTADRLVNKLKWLRAMGAEPFEGWENVSGELCQTTAKPGATEEQFARAACVSVLDWRAHLGEFGPLGRVQSHQTVRPWDDYSFPAVPLPPNVLPEEPRRGEVEERVASAEPRRLLLANALERSLDARGLSVIAWTESIDSEFEITIAEKSPGRLLDTGKDRELIAHARRVRELERKRISTQVDRTTAKIEQAQSLEAALACLGKATRSYGQDRLPEAAASLPLRLALHVLDEAQRPRPVDDPIQFDERALKALEGHIVRSHSEITKRNEQTARLLRGEAPLGFESLPESLRGKTLPEILASTARQMREDLSAERLDDGTVELRLYASGPDGQPLRDQTPLLALRPYSQYWSAEGVHQKISSDLADRLEAMAERCEAGTVTPEELYFLFVHRNLFSTDGLLHQLARTLNFMHPAMSRKPLFDIDDGQKRPSWLS